MLIRNFVRAALLNSQSGESETPTTYAPIKGNTMPFIEREFSPRDRVRNTKTGETGTVSTASPKDTVTTPVIYDKEFDEWGTIWDTPTHRLEKLP